jgi:hypothetical protein
MKNGPTQRDQDRQPARDTGPKGSPPDLMTESELIHYLRIPKVSGASDYRNVIENLKRMHGLPRIHICGKPLYPLKAVRAWVDQRTNSGK